MLQVSGRHAAPTVRTEVRPASFPRVTPIVRHSAAEAAEYPTTQKKREGIAPFPVNGPLQTYGVVTYRTLDQLEAPPGFCAATR
jgi:hypothetical protein